MDEHQAGAQVGAAFERSLNKAGRGVSASAAPAAVPHDPDIERLTLLAERMAPVVRDLPDSIDLFDTGFLPGPPPRYWVDMLSFVEMARDHLTYRFLQDSRLGRTVITETTSLDAMTDAVTAYIAQRLLERERQIAELELRAELGALPPSPYASPYANVVQPPQPAAWAPPQSPVMPQPVPFPTPQAWPVAPQNGGMQTQPGWTATPQPAPFAPPLNAPMPTEAGGLGMFGFGKKPSPVATPVAPDPLTGMTQGSPGVSYRTAGLLFLVGIAIGAVMIVLFALSSGR